MTWFTFFFWYSDGMRIMTSWFSDKGLASAIFSILWIFYSLEYKMNTKKQIALQKTQSNEKKQIDVNFLFRWLTDKLESDIKTSVDYQIEKKMDSYFKKFIW
jgi:phosphate/sulfate permease